MCHCCRKGQISFNSVLDKCQEILENLNGSMIAFREEIGQMQDKINEKIEIAAGQIKRSEINTAEAIEKQIAKCFENVLSNKSPTVPRRSMRTRKRARTDDLDPQVENLDKTPVQTSATVTFADVLKKNSPKQATVKHTRPPVIIVKPKEASQTAKQTKHELRNKVDRAANSINAVREASDGSIILGVESAVNIQDIAKSMQEKIGEKYEVRVPTPKKPRLKIVGVEDEMSEKELSACLTSQNTFLNELELKLITSYSTKSIGGDKSFNYIIEVDSNAHQMMLESGRLNIGWERCRVLECFGIIRCFKCCGYGHKSDTCKSGETCGKCSGQHKSSECNTDEIRCVNCVQINTTRNLNNSTNHYAFSQDCPTYKKMVARKRQQIEREI